MGNVSLDSKLVHFNSFPKKKIKDAYEFYKEKYNSDEKFIREVINSGVNVGYGIEDEFKYYHDGIGIRLKTEPDIEFEKEEVIDNFRDSFGMFIEKFKKKYKDKYYTMGLSDIFYRIFYNKSEGELRIRDNNPKRVAFLLMYESILKGNVKIL